MIYIGTNENGNNVEALKVLHIIRGVSNLNWYCSAAVLDKYLRTGEVESW